ncbi:venom peptide SjAPI-2-like [Pelobates fuscus]|uniref:venom peptide SjAPI-2-like n=1 Tax=Pelobates fuscus TaxID=191477 RepID=UPI002FE4E554
MKIKAIILLLGLVLCLALVSQAKVVTVPCDQPHAEQIQCGTACPVTCANIHDPPTFCNLMCVWGCFCVKGYYANSHHICVRAEDCR